MALTTTSARQDKVWLTALLIVTGLFLGIAYAYYQGSYKGATFPKDTFLCMPSDAGNDFYHLFRTVKAGSPYAYEWSLYFPLTYIPLFLLTPFKAGEAYLMLFALFLGGAVHMVWTHLKFLQGYARIAATLIIAFLSYPIIFILDRGNLEVLLFLFIYLFFIAYRKGQLKWAALFLACAASMKLYPIVLGVLFFTRKHWLYFAATVLLAVVLTCGSAALYPGGMMASFQSISGKMVQFKEVYVVGDAGLPYTSSYFSLVKIALAKLNLADADLLRRVLPFYSLGAVAIGGLFSGYVMLFERVLWKKVLVLTAMMILLPQVTVDYKLIHLLLPLMLFLAAEERTRFDFVYALIFGLLLIPKTFPWIDYKTTLQPLPFSNAANPLLLTLFLLLIVADRFLKPKSTEQETVPASYAPARA